MTRAAVLIVALMMALALVAGHALGVYLQAVSIGIGG